MYNSEDFKRFLYSFLESLPYGVMILSHDGKIKALNRNISFMFNIFGVNSIGLPYTQILEPRLKTVFEKMMEQIKSQGFVAELDIPLSVGEEEEVVLSLNASFLFSDESKERDILVVCREMTARQEIERMKELEKLKTDFMSSITHDLKAPLTSIIGYTDLLLETASERIGPEAGEYLGIIKEEGIRLTRMINDILNATKIEYGKLTLNPEQVLLKKLLEDVVQKFEIHKNNFRFVVSADNRIPSLWLDKELMERVFMNLISNAIKYSPNGGEIKVDAYPSGQNVRVDVIDYGIGLSEDSLSHIFEKFFRVKSEATKGIGGTGLGLVIVKGLVEAHGGSMAVSSKENAGSTFSVILPLSLERNKP